MSTSAWDYRDLLRFLHWRLLPRTYVEIGVHWGRTLAYADRETVVVGVDPDPHLPSHPTPNTRIYPVTSDDFFEFVDVPSALNGYPVDLAFIDGMHLFEYALRDFRNLERHSTSRSVIALHDTLPPEAAATSRQPRAECWTGDVWKLVPLLSRHRPALKVRTFDVGPSGLTIVTGLDPGSEVLDRQFENICDEATELSYEKDFLGSFRAEPVDRNAVAQLLRPAAQERTPTRYLRHISTSAKLLLGSSRFGPAASWLRDSLPQSQR